jgi:hypothetical protein
MILCDYVLLILNCKNYRHKADLQRELWLSNIPESIQYFHIIGDKELCSDKSYYFDFDNKFLYVSTSDDYVSLPHKIITAFKAVNETFNYKYIYKTDDDQILIQPDFFSHLNQQLENINNCHYGGFSLRVKTHVSKYNLVHPCLPDNLILNETLYCNGRFYLLSKKAVEHLLTKEEKIQTHCIEDHAIGLYLADELKENILHFNSNLVLKDMN